MFKSALLACDFYKVDHRRQYPDGTTEVYSNFTPRSSRMNGVDSVVFFGLQYFILDFLIAQWNETFFKADKEIVVKEYSDMMKRCLGKNQIGTKHLEDLHDLGYLPILIKALPEGSVVPIGVPVLTIKNTHPDFFWITNYLETALSAYLWQPITSATIAFEYKKLLLQYAKKTGTHKDFVDFQAHDFSFRGMPGLESAALSGAGHLTSFKGTDTIPAIKLMEDYYDFYECEPNQPIIGASVPATEHSVMSIGSQRNELDTFRRLITEVYPSGIVSIVSDTWDFWKVLEEYIPQLKSIIMSRDGKVVIRPDSGDPVKIICGDPDAEDGSSAFLGAVEVLYNIFGGTVTNTGHKMLDSHIGLIYGDSITLDRARFILERLDSKGFASGNIVFGIGSFTYQYNTRDTFGFAMKATSGIVNGERVDIFKNPKTDCGEKKSAKGLLRVDSVAAPMGIELKLFQQCTESEEADGLLVVVFDGAQLNHHHFARFTVGDIRYRLDRELKLIGL